MSLLCFFVAKTKVLWLGASLPTVNVLELLRRQGIDGNAERAEFETRNLSIDFRRQQVNTWRQRSFVLHQILNRKRLVREAHVHHAGRVSFGCCEIDQSTFYIFTWSIIGRRFITSISAIGR